VPALIEKPLFTINASAVAFDATAVGPYSPKKDYCQHSE